MDGAPIRVLATGYAPVPGSSPHASALLGLVAGIRAEIDLVTLKTENLPHVQHVGHARMFRVPVPTGAHASQREAFGRAVSRQLESQSYDVVHVRGPIEGRVVAQSRRSSGFRFIYEVATFPDEAEGPAAEATWLEAHVECIKEADLLLVPTQAAARSLSERGHAGKVAVVQPGVDVNTFDWWPNDEAVRPRILYLGSFEADRDLATVLEAVRAVSRNSSIRVLMAGEPDSERRERVRRLVQAFDLREVVEVRGEPRPGDLPMLIGASDICLAPASATPRFQDFGDVPQPLLEYLACRRPVIAAGVPGVAEVLRDDKEGLLYPPGDEHVLAESMLALLGEPTLRERLVESAYDRVRSEFSEGARRRRIAKVYEMLMPGSQQFDAWSEAFTRETTGSRALPEGDGSLHGGLTPERGEPDEAGVIYTTEGVRTEVGTAPEPTESEAPLPGSPTEVT